MALGKAELVSAGPSVDRNGTSPSQLANLPRTQLII